jgi:hypothetical protein
MTTAESFRDEHFYRLSQQLGARILKHPLGLSIHQDNLACPVNHHHGIRRRLDNKPKAPRGCGLSFRLVRVVEILDVRASFIFPHRLTSRLAGFPCVEMMSLAAHFDLTSTRTVVC